MVINIEDTNSKYDLILSDPPWSIKRGGKKAVRPNSSGEPLEYNTLSLDDIKKHLEIASSLTNENSILFLWTIDKYLYQAEEIAKSLGYKTHARMIWSKGGMGIPAAFTVRYSHEYLLFMYKGKLIPIEKSERGKIADVFVEKPRKHSQKPEISYEIIERLYPNLTKLEMYARRERDGWDCWGNEV